MEKLWNCLIEWNHRGHNPSGVEKHYPKSFEDMKKLLPILEKIVMKFFLNSISKLNKIYYLKHGALSATLSFCCIYFWCMTLHQECSLFFKAWLFVSSFSILWCMILCQQFFLKQENLSVVFSLHDILSAVFCPICYVCNVLMFSLKGAK